MFIFFIIKGGLRRPSRGKYIPKSDVEKYIKFHTFGTIRGVESSVIALSVDRLDARSGLRFQRAKTKEHKLSYTSDTYRNLSSKML
jgi:hypothetical protein